MDGWTVGWKSPVDPILRAPAVLIIIQSYTDVDCRQMYIRDWDRDRDRDRDRDWASLSIEHLMPQC